MKELVGQGALSFSFLPEYGDLWIWLEFKSATLFHCLLCGSLSLYLSVSFSETETRVSQAGLEFLYSQR